MFVYHLSHIDLDGYGCQYLTSKVFKNIKYYNSHYGYEIICRLENIKQDFLKDKENLNSSENEYFILISDLNLSVKEANLFHKFTQDNNIKIQLLDHHISGEETSKHFDWYYLDETKSGSLIVYEWLMRNYTFDIKKEYQTLIKTINSIDIWKPKENLFEFGKVCLGMISSAKEINRIIFPQDALNFQLFLIEKANSYLMEKKSYINFDDDLYQIKKAFFKIDKDNTKNNLSAIYVTNLLTLHKDRLTLKYKNYIGILGYCLGNVSILGNKFLETNTNYDFYMDINSRGFFSLRSNDKIDVSIMAQEIGKGGGHKNASGGKIDHFKDSFIYLNILNFVQNHLNNIKI